MRTGLINKSKVIIATMKKLSKREYLDCVDAARKQNGIQSDLAREKLMVHEVCEAIDSAYARNQAAFEYCMKFGDGNGAAILMYFKKVIGFDFGEGNQKQNKKKVISASIRRSVFERDLYRCKQCGTHIDLTVDHVFPESAGGSSDISNLQTLCRTCNCKKGVKHV